MDGNLLRAGFKILKNGLFGRKQPVIVAFSVTNECNKDCQYCSSRNHVTEDRLQKNELFKIFDELEELGTEIISLSGGEPLLREDIGKIVSYAKEKDFFVSMNSNGSLVPEKKAVVRKLDRISLSIEGSREIHEKIRGGKSFDEVVEAVKVSKNLGVDVKLASTINKYNWNKIESLLEIAGKFDCKISSDGYVKRCGRDKPENPENVRDVNFQKAFERLEEKKCFNCWCAERAAICQIYSLDLNCILDYTLNLFN